MYGTSLLRVVRRISIIAGDDWSGRVQRGDMGDKNRTYLAAQSTCPESMVGGLIRSVDGSERWLTHQQPPLLAV